MSEQQRGRFITLEGAEGVGKSTLLPEVKKLLASYGVDICTTREPGGTPLGEQVREVLLGNVEPGHEPMCAKAELLLMFASRAQHIETVIEPALANGTWVLCDRFTDASFAYQGGGRQLGEQRVAVIEQWVQQGLTPDLTLLLDASRDTSNARTQKRRSLDRIESEGDEFFERVRQAYLQRAQKFPHRFRVLDANADLDTVSTAMRDVLAPEMEKWLSETVES